ncbi:MAG TPA: hypothetical protein VN903_12445 [Polyangia bacterium]|jgi:hypothetical protein|nr:hypothetical protein [Polyangia bacterium]
MRASRVIATSIASSIAVAAAGCYTVDLGEPPSDINACRPSQSYFVYGSAGGDAGMGNNGIWRDLLDKDYSGKKCHDSACHGSGSTNSLRLTVPTCVPLMPMDPACPVAVPLTGDWADNYRSAAEQMNCANVGTSKLLEFPSAIQVHGGGKLFDRNAPNAEPDLIIGWVAAAP